MAHDLTVGMQNPMTTRGDLIYENATPAPARLAAGTSGQYLQTKGSGADPVWATVSVASALPTGSIQGLMFAWVSSSTVTVTPGLCRDSADAANIQVATSVGKTTVTLTTDAAINGNDKKTMSGTVATTAGGNNVQGTGTHFTTDFGTRAMTGTFNTVSNTSTVTGTGTKFMTECAVNDLIGNSSGGWNRIASVQSDTSLTVFGSITLASGASGSIMENVVFQAGTQAGQHVDRIFSDTSLNMQNTAPANASGLSAYAGAVVGNANTPIWYYLWTASGGSGTGFYFSTQRTTPYGVTGYTTSTRRIGAIAVDSSYNLRPCVQKTDGPTRYVHYEDGRGGDYNPISGVSNSAWTSSGNGGGAAVNRLIPPTSRLARFRVEAAPNSGSGSAYIRESGYGSGAFTRNAAAFGTSSQAGAVIFDCGVDAQQQFEYATDFAGGTANINIIGFWDQLA